MSAECFEVLQLLLDHQGHTIDRQTLLDRMGGSAQQLDGSIAEIRRALGETGKARIWIEDVAGGGFRFIGAATADAEATLAAQAGANSSSIYPAQAAHPGGAESYPGNELFQFHTQPQRRSHSHWVAALLVLAAGAAVFFVARRNRPEPLPVILASRQLTHSGGEKSALILSPDGSTAWYSKADGTLQLWQLSVSDGTVRPLLSDAKSNAVIQAVSNDGQKLLVTRYPAPDERRSSSLWEIDSNGANPKLLVARGWSGAWSPDGRQLAYSLWGDHGVYLANADGSNAHRIARVPGCPWFLHWSPKGNRLVMASIVPLETASSHPEGPLYRVFVATGRTRLIQDDTGHAVYGANPVVAADQLHIMFTHAAGDTTNVWEVNRRNGHMQEVTSNRNDTELAATGPLQNQIVTEREALHARLFRLQAQQPRLQPFPTSIETRDLAFSSDGRWIAYVDLAGALWQAHADGSHPVRLLDAKWNASDPAWGPDSRQVIVSAAPQGGLKKLYRLPAIGTAADSSANPITFGMGVDRDANWSADRKHVLFCRTVSGMSQIEWLDLDSGSLQTIADSRGKCSPRLSPAGVMSAIDQNSHVLYLRRSLNARWEPILTDLNGIHANLWSHDGHSLYFLSGTSPGLWKRYDLRTDRITTAADLGLTAGWATGPWHSLAFTAGDDLIVSSDTSGSEYYLLTLGSDQ